LAHGQLFFPEKTRWHYSESKEINKKVRREPELSALTGRAKFATTPCSFCPDLSQNHSDATIADADFL